MPAGPGLSIEESARRLAIYERVERRLFEIVGGWAASTPEAEVRLRFASDSYKHAWHAELWRERRPQLRERNPPDPGADDPVTQLLDALARAEGTIEPLAGVYRVVLPRLAAAYVAHLDVTSTVSDAPVIRALQLTLHDELDDWRSGELLLQSWLHTAADVDRAVRVQAELEAVIAPAGGVAGEP